MEPGSLLVTNFNHQTDRPIIDSISNVDVNNHSRQRLLCRTKESLTELNVRSNTRLAKNLDRTRNSGVLRSQKTILSPDLSSVKTTPCAGEKLSRPSRKRASYSCDATLPSPKRVNRGSIDTKETNCEIFSPGSRELATAETCQVTSQQPRGVGFQCLLHSDNLGSQSQDKRVRRKKTRRGKKKNRRFLKKANPVCEPGRPGTSSNVNNTCNVCQAGCCCATGNLNHDGSTELTCSDCAGDTGIYSNTGDTKNYDSTCCAGTYTVNSSATGDGENLDNNHYTDDAASTGHSTDLGHSHKLVPDDEKEEDLFVLIQKKNGIRYTISQGDDRILGRGSFGIVYKGYKIDGTSKIPVAIKVIQKSSVKCIVEDDELGVVPNEVAMMNKVKGHPNAIQLMDYVQMRDFVAIIMERPLNCKDLFDIREQQSFPISENYARKVIKQLSCVLLAMEKKHLIHRDIKLENVLVDMDSVQVKLIDFGLTTSFKPGVPMKTFSGTRENSPPEYLLTGEYEGPKDTVWTLGLLLYNLVCGDEPFASLFEASVRPLSIPSHLSSGLQDLLSGMLRKNPSRRLTLEQVQNHAWMTSQTNSLSLPFGYRRSFKQKY